MNKEVLRNKITPLIKIYKRVLAKLFKEDHGTQITTHLCDFSLEKRSSLQWSIIFVMTLVIRKRQIKSFL